MAVLGIIQGQNGMKLGRVGHWFEFLANTVPINLISKTLKWPFGEFESLIGNLSSGRLTLVSLKLQQASAYYLVIWFSFAQSMGICSIISEMRKFLFIGLGVWLICNEHSTVCYYRKVKWKLSVPNGAMSGKWVRKTLTMSAKFWVMRGR